MGEVVVGIVVAACFGATMALLRWLGVRVRRRGSGGAGAAFLGPFEEMWHPAAHRARTETQVVEERVAPAPTPDRE